MKMLLSVNCDACSQVTDSGMHKEVKILTEVVTSYCEGSFSDSRFCHNSKHII